MGRFFACFGFGSSKHGKRVKYQRNRDQESTIQTNPVPEPIPIQYSLCTLPNKPSHPLPEARNRRDGSLNISPTEEVTCVKSHEYVVLSYEEADSVNGKKQDKKEKEESAAKASKPESSSEDIAVPHSPSFRSTCPPTHRYRNREDSDDEDKVFDDCHDEFGMAESISSAADSSMYVFGSNRKNARLRTAYICPVLNPVENLSQWNVVKSKGALIPTPQKENLKLEQESTTSKSKAFKSSQEPSIDASLSNWLASSEATPVSKIATTLALEDTVTPPVKSSTLQGSSSPGISDRIVETVAEVSDEDRDSASSFKGIPNTTSKYREDKTVNWHSTPFETRLERALNSKGVAKA